MQDDKFKVKYGNSKAERPRVLLPLSFGEGSVVLLDMVLSHLEEQCRNERAVQGYDLVVVHVGKDDSRLQQIKQHYEGLLGRVRVEFATADPSLFVRELGRLHVSEDYTSSVSEESETMDLEQMLAQFDNRSSQQDFLQQIVREMIHRAAIARRCSVIIYGHSMTRLADETLALTVKGRGSEIFTRLTDGQFEYANTSLHVIHPLRDVLLSEIKAYVRFSELGQFVEPKPEIKHKSAKNKTIDELVREYFETVESEYPEVISTVVKIGTKLDVPEGIPIECVLCHELVYQDSKTWLEQMSESANTESKSAVPLCYGCLVNVGVGQEVQWPLKRPSEQDILSEYIIQEE
ncbi:hypothetical protein OGAPHI_003674 [Ogataea philodendri]|uniref:Cytoplasmic tRNA 2-thiolation protein 2 n=1 Tax=Ogataea philodendri TaxID=1378263 RepID=A0A9P8P4N8_9ASCO|nr:uncharacterized protein OGAPHI_003674 [Ogataea philodendri]KAH3665488.1 hypothetical protein OGAPHI_003674 [Ogataea philodendri]